MRYLLKREAQQKIGDRTGNIKTERNLKESIHEPHHQTIEIKEKRLHSDNQELMQ